MKFLYVHTGSNLPPDIHLIQGLRESAHEVLELVEKGYGFGKYIRFARRFSRAARGVDAVIVGYGLPLLTPLARGLSPKTIVFNAVSSQYEANIISRGVAGRWSPSAMKWWFIDFISFLSSTKILLESEGQVDYVRAHFLAPKKKLVRAWMGVDESVFFRDESVQKSKDFTVLFRGRFLPESGILTVIEAAKKLEDTDVRFIIIGHGFMYREVNALMAELEPKNVELIREALPPAELREKMLSCHVSLGQLADHPRLLRTLPAKLYESLALGLPFLTGRNAGVLELLKEDETCLAVKPGDAGDLAGKILYLRNNPEVLRKVSERGYRLYKERLGSRKLADEFVSTCFGK